MMLKGVDDHIDYNWHKNDDVTDITLQLSIHHNLIQSNCGSAYFWLV